MGDAAIGCAVGPVVGWPGIAVIPALLPTILPAGIPVIAALVLALLPAILPAVVAAAAIVRRVVRERVRPAVPLLPAFVIPGPAGREGPRDEGLHRMY